MSRKRRTRGLTYRKPAITPAKLSDQLKRALRTIIFQWRALRAPLAVDEIDPGLPTGAPRYRVRGAESYEQLQEQIEEFAGRIWQFKDGLIKWMETQDELKIEIRDETGKASTGGGGKAAERTIEDAAKTCLPLLLCADLFNSFKHYDDCNRSGYAPFLAHVELDTSKAGVLGIHYDGATKRGYFNVTIRTAVPIRIEMWSGNQAVNFGDAIEITIQAFHFWIPLVRQMGLLSAGRPEERAILRLLDEVAEHVKTSSRFKPGEQVIQVHKLSPAQQIQARKDPSGFIAAMERP